MEVGRIGNWNPEKANFPTLDACAFAITPGTLLHRPVGSTSHLTLYEGRRHPLFNYALIRVKYKLAT